MTTSPHYSIGQFSRRVGISEYTLRYYEKEGLISPNRNPNGIRYYTAEDVEWMTFLMNLKSTGMKMADLRKYIVLRAQGKSTLQERREMLKERQEVIRERIAALQETLTVLDDKLGWYDDQIAGRIPAGQPYVEYLKQKKGGQLNEK